MFLFGNLFHVFVINVVLAHKTVNSPVQQVNSWREEEEEKVNELKQTQGDVCACLLGELLTALSRSLILLRSIQVVLPWCRDAR